MKLNSLIKTAAVLVLVAFMMILASCAESASNITDDDNVSSGDDITVDVFDTTAPDETTEESKDNVPDETTEKSNDTASEDTTAKETDHARDVIEPIVLGEDDSEAPDEVITGEELEALVTSADEAWGWLCVYNAFLDKDAEPIIYRDTEYYPVADYKTLDEFRERLLECFSVSLVNNMIDTAFNSDTPLFIVEGGVLMACEHTRLTDVDMQIPAKYYASRTGERTAYFVRPVQVQDINNGMPSVSRNEYTANMVFEYGKWVFNSYPDFDTSSFPQTDR